MTSDTPHIEPRSRRAACAFIATAAALVLTACTIAPPSWQQRRDSPFWEREDQRD